MNIPKLRFKEFNDEWVEGKISDLIELNPKNSSLPESFIYIDLDSVSHGRLLKKKVINRIDAPSRAQRNVKLYDILYQTVRPYQKNNLYIDKLSELPYIASTGYAVLREKNIYSKFLFNKLYTYNFVNEVLDNCTGTSYPAINANDLGTIKIYHPSNVEEQRKIGDFLSLLDKKIELQTKKIEALKLFKSYTKSEIFKNGNHVCKLGAILNKWNKKNKDGAINYVESISNKAGFIPQSEQFEDRNVASKNLRNYYVIKKGVFGYNPSRLNVGSLALKENDFISVVSPLYECFTTTQNNTYLFEWFNSNNFKKETFSKFEGGVRNTLNFNNLCDIPINLPDIETQNQYAKYFNKINFKISLEEQKLSELVKFKKGLLQEMFI